MANEAVNEIGTGEIGEVDGITSEKLTLMEGRITIRSV